MDDPLAAVDPEVATQIYTKCVQTYLKDKTRNTCRKIVCFILLLALTIFCFLNSWKYIKIFQTGLKVLNYEYGLLKMRNTCQHE